MLRAGRQLRQRVAQRIAKWLVTFAFLLASLVCYAMGSQGGLVTVLILGLLFEGAFWYRLLVAPRRTVDKQ